MSELDLLRKIADLEARLARLESAGAPYTTTSAGAMTTPALNVGSATGATTGMIITSSDARFQNAVELGLNGSNGYIQGYNRVGVAFRALEFWTNSGGPQGLLDTSGNFTLKGFVAVADGMTAPSATAGAAKIYVDTADGDLKIIFGDGTIKTIVTDT